MTSQLTRLGALGIFLCMSAAVAQAQDTKKPQDKKGAAAPNYYPLQAGNEWQFRVTVGGNTATAISRIAKIETIDNVPLSRLEASVNGKVVATEHLSATPKGIFRYRNNKQEISPPLCLLKLPITNGAKWKGELKVANDEGKYSCEAKEETIEVPAGKFKAMRVTIFLEGKTQNVTTSYWFVPNIGFVRQTVEAGNLNVVMDLEKYTIAKGKK